MMNIFLNQKNANIKVLYKYIFSVIVITFLSACGSTSEGKSTLPVQANTSTSSVEKEKRADSVIKESKELSEKTKSKSTYLKKDLVDPKEGKEKNSISKTKMTDVV